MTKKAISFLTIVLLSQMARAQFSAGINAGADMPLRSTSDSVPGIRGGHSFNFQIKFGFSPRMSTNLTVGRRMLNTADGFEALAHQNGYTQQKGFSIHSRSAGMTTLALGVGVNVLSTGNTDCGMPKPSLILGIKGGALLSDSKIDGEVKNESGTTVFEVQQTGRASVPFYALSLDLQYPVSNTISIVSGAAWSRGATKMDLQRTSNGANTLSHFAYSDIQLNIGMQIALGKGHNEKGIKRNVEPPQAMVEGQPIGGIVVKGGQNPRPKGNAMVAESPIGGIVVKGGQNPRRKGNAMVAGSPIGGIVVKGGKNPGSGDTTKKAFVVYTEPFTIQHPALLHYLGMEELVIEKGEYALEYDEDGAARVLLHLHKEGIVHRDLAARSFTFDGTSEDGQPMTYSVEPQYMNGVAKEILVTFKGHSEKGIK